LRAERAKKLEAERAAREKEAAEAALREERRQIDAERAELHRCARVVAGRLGLYKILSYFEAFVHESIILL